MKMKKKHTLVFLLLLIFSFLYKNTILAQTSYTTTVIESKKNIHPRLYLEQAGINQLKSQITSGKLKSLYTYVINAVNRYPSPPTTNVAADLAAGADLRFWGDRLLNLSIVYKLSGNAAYLSKAQGYATYLMTAPDSFYSTPGLEPGHHLTGLSVFFDWCYNEMDATLKSNIIAFLNTKGNLFNTWLSSSAKGTDYYLSNQFSSRVSGLGVASLAFYECFDTKPWINTAMQKFMFLDSVRGSDGGFSEGVSYGGYDMDFQMRFFDLTKSLLSYNFYNSAWWNNSSMFQIYMALPSSFWTSNLQVIDIGDCPRYLWYGPNYLLRGIAKEKRDGYAQQQADLADAKGVNYENSAIAFNLLRYDATVVSKAFTNLPTWHHFDNYGIVTARDSWVNGNSVVSFTCGPAAGLQFVQNNAFEGTASHGHPNANSFSIFSNGEFLIRNAGYIQRRTQYENTLLVDTKGQLDQPYSLSYWTYTSQGVDKKYPTMVKVESNSDFDIMVGDATLSYPAVNKYERTLIYLKSESVALVMDTIASTSVHNFELLFHAQQTADSVVASNNKFKIKGDYSEMIINPLTTSNVSIVTADRYNTARNGVGTAYTTYVIDLKKTTKTWRNAVAFSWNDKNITSTDVSIVSQNSNVWIFKIGAKLLSYDWANKTAVLNVTDVKSPFENKRSFVSLIPQSGTGIRTIELILRNDIVQGATAKLYSINGICMKTVNIESNKLWINPEKCPAGVYLLKVINGMQIDTHKIILY
jgi:hypothetical protein